MPLGTNRNLDRGLSPKHRGMIIPLQRIVPTHIPPSYYGSRISLGQKLRRTEGVFAVRARCDAGRHRDFKPDQQADGRVHKYRKLKPEEAMIFDIGSGGGQA